MGCNHEDKLDDCGCNCNTPSERVRYYPRQLLTADDMRAEQEYFLEKQRRHNRMLHGRGVVCGLQVCPSPDSNTAVVVCHGYALSPCGNEINLTKEYTLELADCLSGKVGPCEGYTGNTDDDVPKEVYIAIRYVECPTRPARTLPTGCGCDETPCEYSRIRDGFEIRCLTELPDSHKLSCPQEKTGTKSKPVLKKNLSAMMKNGLSGLEKINAGNADTNADMPIALIQLLNGMLGTCPPCPKDDWVVLAVAAIDPEKGGLIISNDIRRIVINLSVLMERMYCLFGAEK